MNDTPISSNGFVPNPVIERESLGHEPPPGGIDAEGYIIIGFRDDMPDNFGIYVSLNGFDFEINNAIVMINIKYQNLPRWIFCEDINQTLGYHSRLERRDYTVYSKDGFRHGDYLYPFDKEYVNKFKYSDREPGNRTQGDIPDWDPPRKTSGLVLRVEPIIYTPKPFDPFNQFQQPTFTPPKDKIHKKQRLNKKLK